VKRCLAIQSQVKDRRQTPALHEKWDLRYHSDWVKRLLQGQFTLADKRLQPPAAGATMGRRG
jgi:hypothetical protein